MSKKWHDIRSKVIELILEITLCKRIDARTLAAIKFLPILAFIVVPAQINAQSTANQSFLVELVLDDKISIQANNASLKDILLEIQSITGIPVNFVSDTTERVSINITENKLEDAIGKLTPNHMVIHGTDKGKVTISELIIISDDPASTGSSTDGSLFLPSGEPAPAVTIPGSEPVQANNPLQNDENTQEPQPEPMPSPSTGN